MNGLGISDKILIFILVKGIRFNTVKSPLGTSLIQWDIEIDLICPISVNPLMTPHILIYRPLPCIVKDLHSCPILIIKGLTDKGQFQYLTGSKGPLRGLTCIQHTFFN